MMGAWTAIDKSVEPAGLIPDPSLRPAIADQALDEFIDRHAGRLGRECYDPRCGVAAATHIGFALLTLVLFRLSSIQGLLPCSDRINDTPANQTGGAG